MVSAKTLVITLIIVAVTMLGLKIFFPDRTTEWYISRAKIVISIGFMGLILFEVVRIMLG